MHPILALHLTINYSEYQKCSNNDCIKKTRAMTITMDTLTWKVKKIHRVPPQTKNYRQMLTGGRRIRVCRVAIPDIIYTQTNTLRRLYLYVCVYTYIHLYVTIARLLICLWVHNHTYICNNSKHKKAFNLRKGMEKVIKSYYSFFLKKKICALFLKKKRSVLANQGRIFA